MKNLDICNKLKLINKTNYNFDNDQALVYNLIMSGKSLTYIKQNTKISKLNKTISYVRDITGIGSDELKYIQDKWKKTNSRLYPQDNEYKIKCGELFCESFLGYKDTKMYPKYVYLRLAQLSKKYNYKIVYETLLDYKNTIEYYLKSKKFSDENHKINYIIAIIKNHLEDMPPKEDSKIVDNSTELLENVNINNTKNSCTRKDFSSIFNNDFDE